eukprot:gene38943-44148_t
MSDGRSGSSSTSRPASRCGCTKASGFMPQPMPAKAPSMKACDDGGRCGRTPGWALEPVRAQYADDIDPIVDQMCVFASSCGGETASSEAPSSEPPSSDVIPAGFPLAAGFPTDSEPGPDNGLTGPGEDVEVPEGVDVCGSGLPTAPSIDRLAARWANPEDYRSRVLLAFEDAEAAIAYQGDFLQSYRSCPRDPGSDGYVSLNDVRRTAVGGESWAVVRTFEFQGSP